MQEKFSAWRVEGDIHTKASITRLTKTAGSGRETKVCLEQLTTGSHNTGPLAIIQVHSVQLINTTLQAPSVQLWNTTLQALSVKLRYIKHYSTGSLSAVMVHLTIIISSHSAVLEYPTKAFLTASTDNSTLMQAVQTCSAGCWVSEFNSREDYCCW